MSKMLLRKRNRSGENQWQRLMLSDMTVSVPVGWTNSVTETVGSSGQTNVNVTATAAAAIPGDSVIWSIDTGIPVSAHLSFSFFIELVNATAGGGGYGSAQADGCYFWLGIASDVAALATRGCFTGYEHGAAVQPRGMFYQGGNGFTAGNNNARHVCGVIPSWKNVIKPSGGRIDVLNSDKAPFNLGSVISTELTAASVSDTIKIVFAAGKNAAGSYNIPVRLWYVLGDQLSI